MSEVRSGDTRIYYEITGEGTPIVFLHGFSLDRRMWNEQIEFFSNNYKVVTYDARGHGKSEAPETGYAREDRACDLLNLANELNLGKFHLVGLSMGGGDALNFAIDHQERLLSLTLVGSVVSGWIPKQKFRDFTSIAREKGIENARTLFIRSSLINYDNRNPEVKRKLENMMADFSGKPWLDKMKGKYPIRDDLRLSALLYIPTLIIAGQNDIFFRPLAEELSQKIMTSRLEILPNIGHMANMEAPEEFNNSLNRFLEEISHSKERVLERNGV
jgi:pimeloyl-ACP methyl ester carboxylesterase